jgi:protein SOV1
VDLFQPRILQFHRGVRTRATRGSRNIPGKTSADDIKGKYPAINDTLPANAVVTETNEGQQRQYYDRFQQEVEKRGMDKVEVQRDLLLLDMLNDSKPGSARDIRYKHQQAELESIPEGDEDAKVASLAIFLANEIKFEIFEPEEVNHDDDEKTSSVVRKGNQADDLENMVEFELRKYFTIGEEMSNKKHLKFKILNQIMESLLAKRGGLLILPPEFTVEVFQLAQFILDDDDLKLKIRYLSGKLIYSLKKFEFDYLSESQFIEALILNGENDYASQLLEKRAEKVNSRFWYELMVVNQLELRNLKAANDLVDLIRAKFNTEYLDSRIFQMFIDKYSESNNMDGLRLWIERYKKLISDKGGFSNSSYDEPKFDLDEEEALKILKEEQPPKTTEFIQIVEILLKEQDSFNPEMISDLIHFYLSQPSTDAMELVPLLFQHKLKFNSKILPLLNKLQHPKIDELKQFFEEYKAENKLESSQFDILEQFLDNEAKYSKIGTIFKEVEKYLDINGTLSSKMTYRLLQSLLKAGKVDEAFQTLQQLEKSAKLPNENSILPPVESRHYLPFLAYFGRLGDVKKFNKVLKNFSTSPDSKFAYNPIILTQVLNSLIKMKKPTKTIKFVNQILDYDIHRSDPEYIKSDEFKERIFYSAIWKAMKDSLIFAKDHPEEVINNEHFNGKFPNLRLLFVKMIRDKVIPSPKDYNYIISCFLLNKDKYSLLCVLKYLGDKHNLKLTPESAKLLNRYNKELGDDSGSMAVYDPGQQKTLNALHLQTSSGSSSLDPFASRRNEAGSSTEVDTPLIDVTPESPPASAAPTKELLNNEILDWENHYYQTIKSIMAQRNTKSVFNIDYCSQVFKDFGLHPPTMQDINSLFDKYKHKDQGTIRKKGRNRQQTKRIKWFKKSSQKK